nr:venom phosphodiesterase-like [Cherax quadricarinatus]
MNSEVLLMMVTVSMGVSMGYPHPASPSLPDDLDAAPPTLPDDLDPSSCPPTYQQHPLVLISLDGFRAEYLRRGITPTIQHLADKGTRTPYMKPCYPTSTFPNHYTIVTGLYPSVHGIVANRFYDPVFKAEFRVGGKESLKPRWWGGEPIWKTAETQGKRAATFFWPGSEVDGNQPTHWYYYNESIPFQQRIDKVLMWLDLPPETRPDFITLYMHEPDETAHDYGPHSTQLVLSATLVPVVQAVFVAHGPEFRRNTEVEVFHNIELYNLMCHLLGITPAPNNGSWGALHHLLSNPPPPLLLPSYQTPEVAKLPTRGVLEQRLSEAECEAELADTHTLVKLLEQAYNRSASIMSKHLPWGVPHTHQSNFLLVQQDHVTAYSPLVKLPLWTSFTVSSMNQVTRAAPWMSDVRLAPEQSATCSSYHTVTSYNVTAQPLFPPEFSSRRENQNLSYLITNAVPFTSQLTQRWQQLINFIGIWMQMYGTLNIISGPVFDYDADTLADNMLNLR